jgi:hypothetical protein
MGGRSSQRKGKDYERYIAKLLAKAFDTNVRRTPCSGGLDIKGDLRNLSGPLEAYVFECKKQEKLNIWKCLQQTFLQAGSGKKGVLVFSRNHERDYVCMDIHDFIELLQLIANYQAKLKEMGVK